MPSKKPKKSYKGQKTKRNNKINRTTKPTVYFGYGSNLWRDQMLKRCPTSEYLGIARLNGYRWIINDRGYANVVQIKDEQRKESDVVWGLVYSFQQDDEERLDINEGVPFAYTKEMLSFDFWAAGKHDSPKVDGKSVEEEMLVYIDRIRTEPDKPKKEYIYRMNMGIKDAVEQGMPESYVEQVLRRFIPDEEDKDIENFARQQALFFEDEDESEDYAGEESEDGDVDVDEDEDERRKRFKVGNDG